MMKEVRLQIRTSAGKVTGFWDGQNLRTWHDGGWVIVPANTRDGARDELRAIHEPGHSQS